MNAGICLYLWSFVLFNNDIRYLWAMIKKTIVFLNRVFNVRNVTLSAVYVGQFESL